MQTGRAKMSKSNQEIRTLTPDEIETVSGGVAWVTPWDAFGVRVDVVFSGNSGCSIVTNTSTGESKTNCSPTGTPA
jgi:hypothetical protein